MSPDALMHHVIVNALIVFNLQIIQTSILILVIFAISFSHVHCYLFTCSLLSFFMSPDALMHHVIVNALIVFNLQIIQTSILILVIFAISFSVNKIKSITYPIRIRGYQIQHTLVGCSYRIYQLHFCQGTNIHPTSVLDMTLNHLVLRLQPWSFREYGVPIHCHCSQVLSNMEWLHLIGFYL